MSPRSAAPRAAVVALVLVLLALFAYRHLRRSPQDARGPARDIEVIDVGARALTMAADYKRGKPHKDIYFDGATGTAHLHLILPGQTIPLHIHERSEEATVPVMGSAIVTQQFGSAAGIETTKRRFDEGTLIVSPSSCAHQWENPSLDQFHASLVFTLGAAFHGNQLVGADDPRVASASAPMALDPSADLAQFVTSSDRVRKVDVPVAQGSLSTVFVKDSFPLEPGAGPATLVYVVRGTGRIDAATTQVSVGPKTLVVLRHAPGTRLVADPRDPIVAFVVVMPDGSPQSPAPTSPPPTVTP